MKLSAIMARYKQLTSTVALRISITICTLLIGALSVIALFSPVVRSQAIRLTKAQAILSILSLNTKTTLFKPIESRIRPCRLSNKLSNPSESAKSPHLTKPSPLTIPAGTTIDKLSFFGIDRSSSIIAIADTNGDRVPDATEDFIVSDDPNNEATSALTFSKRTGRYYLGVIAADGPNKQQGEVIIIDNTANSYHGNRTGSFAIGKGTPVGMVVLDSPQGDILIVASLFFKDKILGITSDDRYTITAFLPGTDGSPDGVKQQTILAAGTQLGNNPINFGFGGLAIDGNGTLYANVAAKVQQGAVTMLTGALLSFTDSDNDGIPDKSTLFAEASSSDPNPMTASSIVATEDSQGLHLIVYGNNDIIREPSQIVTYQDVDKDLKADSIGKVFYTATTQFQGFFGSFGDGTSAVEISHLDFADGEALFAFTNFDATGNTVLDAGVAMVRDQGDGSSSAAISIFQAPKFDNDFSGVTLVFGVPRSPDTIPPTITITAPMSGDRLMGGIMATISFTSSDDIGVASHNIAFAANGNNFVSVVSGLPATTQSFQLSVPNIDTTTAAIRVQAIDLGGNVSEAIVDNLIIETDRESPVVTVIAPKAKDKLKGQTNFTITFTSSDNIAVDSHDIDFSSDGGETFTPVTRDLPGNAQSFSVTVPNVKVKRGVIKVTAKDAAGNRGVGLSGIFKIKPSK